MNLPCLCLRIRHSELTVCAEQVAEVRINFSVRCIEELPGLSNYISYYFDIDFVSFSVTRSFNIPILKYSCENIII
jgi:hypothetical protein